MANKLILKGDTSPGKTFRRYLPASVLMVILGIILIAVGIAFSERSAISLVGYSNYEVVYVFGKLLLIVLGIALIALAAVLPFKAIGDAKRCFVDVYDDRVCGGYVDGTGKEAHVVPYELTYDLIQSVSAVNLDVFIQIQGRTIRSMAFNAADIAAAISRQLQRAN